jgi:predicted nucleic acid-binding protein
VKAFLDTSVLVATFYGDHEYHHPSIELFLRYEKRDVSCGAHSLAEVYATLTGMPGKNRAGPDETLLFLGNIRERLTVIALTDKLRAEGRSGNPRHLEREVLQTPGNPNRQPDSHALANHFYRSPLDILLATC